MGEKLFYPTPGDLFMSDDEFNKQKNLIILTYFHVSSVGKYVGLRSDCGCLDMISVVVSEFSYV